MRADRRNEEWQPWAAGALLYAATAVVWTFAIVLAQRGRPDLAALVAVAWAIAMVALGAYMLWSRVRRHSGHYDA